MTSQTPLNPESDEGEELLNHKKSSPFVKRDDSPDDAITLTEKSNSPHHGENESFEIKCKKS